MHTALGTAVAIKFIRPQYASMEDARLRFEIEARAAAKLSTVHAVKVFDYGVTDDGLPYIVMEYLEGESLSDALVRRGALPAAEVAQIIGQAAAALAKAHEAGVVHRDLKPDNIFLAKNVENPKGTDLPYTVKLVDFGIAKMFEAPRVAGLATPPAMGGPTQEGAVIGTPNFMAPEQLTLGGAPGPLTDLWSLGACTFAAMTARIPFEGDVLGDIVIKVCASPLPVPSQIEPNVPQGFDAWFARACSRDPSKRFQSATELAESLANVCGVAREGAVAGGGRRPGGKRGAAGRRSRVERGPSPRRRPRGGESLSDRGKPHPPAPSPQARKGCRASAEIRRWLPSSLAGRGRGRGSREVRARSPI